MDDLEDDLRALPAIKRERVEVDPEDVVLGDLETLADLHEIENMVEAGPRTVWRYDG